MPPSQRLLVGVIGACLKASARRTRCAIGPPARSIRFAAVLGAVSRHRNRSQHATRTADELCSTTSVPHSQRCDTKHCIDEVAAVRGPRVSRRLCLGAWKRLGSTRLARLGLQGHRMSEGPTLCVIPRDPADRCDHSRQCEQILSDERCEWTTSSLEWPVITPYSSYLRRTHAPPPATSTPAAL